MSNTVFNTDFQMPFHTLNDKNRMRNTVFYGRVSTEHEAQISALENQMQWYDDQAKFHPNWIVLDKYIDEGITGTQAKKRPAFLQMIKDAKEGKFDLIVTREVCRFARNTVDTLVTTRELKNLGIEVYFVEDNIWTMDGDGELRLTIMATLAQEESRKVSERVKAGQHISRNNGVIYGNGNILGYDRVGEKYVINEQQAETVRMIFDMYLNDGIGATKIANELCMRKRVAATGQIKWTASSVSRILGNPTYMGYMAYGKSFSNNYLEQKRINNHNSDTYMYVKADFEPIVTEEEWRKCEEIRKSRRRALNIPVVKKTPFGDERVTGPKRESHDKWNRKLKCSCGASFRKNRWHKNKNKEWSYGYECYNQINNGSAKKRRKQGLDDTGFCDMQMIADWKLEIMCKHIIEEIWKDRNAAMKQACKILEKCYQADTDKQTENIVIQKKIDKLKLKIDTLIDMRSEGDISIEEYRNRRKRLDDELANYETKINEYNYAEEVKSEEGINWSKIYATLEKVIDISGAKVDNRFVEKFIARIVPQGNNKFIWYVNLSDVETKNIDIAVEGRKNHATVYIEKESEADSEGEEPSVHRDVVQIRDIFQFLKGKKYSPETMQLRQRSTTNKYYYFDKKGIRKTSLADPFFGII